MTQALIKTLIDRADDLMAAIEGTTDQFEDHVCRLADAITALENARPAIKAHTPGPWTDWPDFDEEGYTGRTIIGALNTPLFCDCEAASEADRHLVRTAPDLLAVLELARTAMNNVPSFDTGIADEHRPGRNLSSYRLLPRLQTVIRQARGQA